MKMSVMEAIGGALTLGLIEWIQLRKAAILTKLLGLMCIGLSAVLWVYLSSATELVSLPSMIEEFLKPLNPFY